MALSEILGCSIDWLLKGGPAEPTPNGYHRHHRDADSVCEPGVPYGNCDNVVDLKHMDVIKDFIDKPLAVELNSCLVKLERISPEAYREVGSYIKGVVNGVEIAMKGSGAADPNKAKVG